MSPLPEDAGQTPGGAPKEGGPAVTAGPRPEAQGYAERRYRSSQSDLEIATRTIVCTKQPAVASSCGAPPSVMPYRINTNRTRRFRKPSLFAGTVVNGPPRLRRPEPAPGVNALVQPRLFVVAKLLVLGNTLTAATAFSTWSSKRSNGTTTMDCFSVTFW